MKKAVKQWENFLSNSGYQYELIERCSRTYYLYNVVVLGNDLICGLTSELELTLTINKHDLKSTTMLANQWISYLNILEINAQ